MSDTEATLMLNSLLCAKYSERAGAGGQGAKYVLLSEAPDNSSWAGRRCDLIAIGVWSSTGNPIIGHEVKASRSDWLRELQEPEKAEAFTKYCTRWYVVAMPGVVKPEELTANWGLMEPTKNGKRLVIRRQAAKNPKQLPVPPRMFALWMRRASEGASRSEIDRICREAIELDRRRSHISPEEIRELRQMRHEHSRLREAVELFERSSGVKIEDRWSMGQVGKAIKLVADESPKTLCQQYARIHNQLSRMQELSRTVATELSKIEGEG